MKTYLKSSHYCFVCCRKYRVKLDSKPLIPISDVQESLCPLCSHFVKQGNIALIQVNDGEGAKRGALPARSGAYCITTRESLVKLIPATDTQIDFDDKKILFVEKTMWELLGIPKLVKNG